jgi:hypothetical protein
LVLYYKSIITLILFDFEEYSETVKFPVFKNVESPIEIFLFDYCDDN